MKRNKCILKKLLLLNIKSIEEGLLQLLYYNTSSSDIRKRCLAVTDFLPAIDVDRIDKPKQVGIMESAVEFCKENAVDSISCKVFINNIDFKVKQNELWQFCEYFGKVLHVFISKDKKTRRSKGFGFVVFSSPYDAQKALKAKKYELRLNGRVMRVMPAVRKKKNAVNVTEKAKISIQDAAEYFIEDMKNEKVLCEENKSSNEDESLINLVLCDDMLLEIFSYLDMRTRITLERICKRWHDLALQSWKQITSISFKDLFSLNNFHASLTDRILISILKKNCSNLKSIDLSTSPYLITQSGLSKIASSCPNLHEINLSHVLLKRDTAKVLGRKLTKLRKLHMTNCLNIGEKGFWWLFKDQEFLEELIITDTPRLVGSCIYMLKPTVRTINFENCSEFNDVGIKYLASRCPSLINLNLSYCSKITDSGLKSLFETCSGISILKLKGIGRNLSSNALLEISFLKDLVDLDVSRNIAVTDHLLGSVARNCKQLKKLNIEACHGDITNTGAAKLCLCKNLIELNISYIVHINDESITKLAMEGRLQKFIIRANPEISDQCAAKCVQYLEDLEILDLSGCFYITDNLAQHARVLTSESNLKIIIGGTQITEEGKVMLQEALPASRVTMQNFHVGMLRNDHDPTLVHNFYPESSDEEEDDESEQEIPQPIVFKPDFDFDVRDDYPTVDEDGEKLWVVTEPTTNEVHNDTLLENQSYHKDNIGQPNNDLNISLDSKTPIVIEEENWDDDLTDGTVWTIPIESLDDFGPTCNEDYDDFLENDDLSRFELIG